MTAAHQTFSDTYQFADKSVYTLGVGVVGVRVVASCYLLNNVGRIAVHRRQQVLCQVALQEEAEERSRLDDQEGPLEATGVAD